MSKKRISASSSRKKKNDSVGIKPISIIPGIIVLAFIAITTYTPNLMAFDSNAPKFLALSISNLFAFLYLIFNSKLRKQIGSLTFFFKTKIGLAYSGFVLFSLLSIFNATNYIAFLHQISILLTVFTSTYLLAVMIKTDHRIINWVVIFAIGMLIIDSFSVFHYISEFIQGRVKDDTDFKSIYSNKNILASAIFVKLPFAIWLFLYGKNKLKILGWISLFMGSTAIFFMVARAFYVGLIVISIFFLIYMFYGYVKTKSKIKLMQSGYYALAIVLAFLVFIGIQKGLFPENKDSRLADGTSNLVTSISVERNQARIALWGWSWLLIKEKPLLGVGSGNWKVEVLKYESKLKSGFTYSYKAHNDFIESAAETGVIGGLFYLGIFVFVALSFLKRIKQNIKSEDNHYGYLFLAAMGMFFYFFDAFFNFPADRPEMQILFGFFLSVAITKTLHPENDRKVDLSSKKMVALNRSRILPLIPILLILSIIVFFLFLNFKSSKTQRIVFQEIDSGKLISSSEKIIAGFSFIPNISANGESIDVIKARYLIKEEKFSKAIEILSRDKSNPWDWRKEYFLSMAYYNLGQLDSVVFYAEKVFQLKPKHDDNIFLLCQALEKNGQKEKVPYYLEKYLFEIRNNVKAWIFATNFYNKIGEIGMAWETINKAKLELPKSDKVERKYFEIYQNKFAESYKHLYSKAFEEFNKKEYNTALKLLNEYIEEVPKDYLAHELRSYIFYYKKDIQKCISETTYIISLSTNQGSIFNLRGSCYVKIDDMKNACNDFIKAASLGDEDGEKNVDKFCKK